MEIEARAASDIERGLAEQRQQLNNQIISGGPQSADIADDTVRAAIQRAIAASADLGVSIAIRQFENVSLSFDWTLANADAREWANERTGELISQINDTTRRRVQSSVAAWVDSGAPLNELIADLEPIFGRDRAELIATTEVTQAYAQGNRIAYQESGVVDAVEWRTANDERVCPICGPLHGEQTGVRRGFGSGITNPPAHPRCRCWIVPVIN